MDIVEEQLEKLLYSIERFKEDMKNDNKRAAIGDMDFIQDRAKGIIYLLLAQLEDESKDATELKMFEERMKIIEEEPNSGFDRDSLFNNSKID